ncbi:hypothetical protein STAS_21400 [Striga asiatica]|uniref:Uncharacterized protein n=1 Tax=Striga asiatica TaxID=4170 RepID=A0A5A7QHS5_STRAF|nr:hypothetical protein STAS_21400 [Striga asiatica]
MTKTGGLARSKTRQSEKTNMASDKVNNGLPITDGSSIGSKTVNLTFEGNMPTIQPPQTQQKESTLMPEVQTLQTHQTQYKESTLMPEVRTLQTQQKRGLCKIKVSKMEALLILHHMREVNIHNHLRQISLVLNRCDFTVAKHAKHVVVALCDNLLMKIRLLGFGVMCAYSDVMLDKYFYVFDVLSM